MLKTTICINNCMLIDMPNNNLMEFLFKDVDISQWLDLLNQVKETTREAWKK